MSRATLALTGALIALSAGASLWAPGALADSGVLDRAEALMRRYDPSALSVYQQTEASEFEAWLDTEAPLYAIPAAVHESVHALGGYGRGVSTYRVYLTDGSALEFPVIGTFPRSEIYGRLGEAEVDHYAEIYLTGTSGEQGLASLLDELNAYTWSLQTWTRMGDALPPGTLYSARDGLGTQMRYLELYLRQARQVHPEDYAALRAAPEILDAIAALWEGAEAALIRSQGDSQLGLTDRYTLHQVYLNVGEIAALYEGVGGGPAFDLELAERYREIRRFSAEDLPSNIQGRAAAITRTRSRTFTLVTIDGETWRCEELAAAAAEGGLDPGLQQQIRYFRSRGEWPCW